jgi:hypothetical protein
MGQYGSDVISMSVERAKRTIFSRCAISLFAERAVMTASEAVAPKTSGLVMVARAKQFIRAVQRAQRRKHFLECDFLLFTQAR